MTHGLKVRLLGDELERLPYRFAVVPLSEDCGFIEWVPQTVTLRNVCTEVYAAEGLTDMKSTLASVHSTYKNFSVSPLASFWPAPHSPPQSCAPQAAWHQKKLILDIILPLCSRLAYTMSVEVRTFACHLVCKRMINACYQPLCLYPISACVERA